MPASAYRTRLYLVRHGQASSEGASFLGHAGDPGLSETGRREILDLAEALSGVSADALVCSDLRRALDSADLLGRTLSLRPGSYPDLREMNFGVWTGLDLERIESMYPGQLSEWYAAPTSYRIPEGESLAELNSRVLALVTKLLDSLSGGSLILVGHGGVNRVILCNALGLHLNHVLRLDQASGCLNVIDYFLDGPTLVRTINWRPPREGRFFA